MAQYHYTMKHLDSSHWREICIAVALQEAEEFRIGCRKVLMLIQEKQFFHQQHLRTCVNNMFLYTDLYSVCVQQHVFLCTDEDTRCEVHWGRAVIFLQKSRFFFYGDLFFWENYPMRESLSLIHLHLLFITYKFGLAFYHPFGLIKFGCLPSLQFDVIFILLVVTLKCFIWLMT